MIEIRNLNGDVIYVHQEDSLEGAKTDDSLRIQLNIIHNECSSGIHFFLTKEESLDY